MGLYRKSVLTPDLYVYPSAISHYLDYYKLYSNSWNQGIEPFKVCSFMFSFVLFWLFCVLCISIRILNLAWQFLQKKVFCSFTGDCSKAVDWFGENGYLNSITLPVHEHGKSYLHLFRSSLISHKNVLKFQFTCLTHFC